ncbi:caspase Dronc [Drosophila sechellia]|uniref:GM25197 n=1 Tax=Drosophila sechellia TaxID=7238 RepID=B4HLS1_DROSE|nr:caspase Dronc [Drosophila sechellia]EDW40953.1 GM25197 [Drosophila sechellia]
MQPPEREIGMPKRHREHIRKNLDTLVEWTNYERLAMECVRQGILSDQMLRNTEDLNGKPFNMDEKDVRAEQHRRLLMKITQRGPTAYNQLINALRNINCLDAAVLLESVDESDSRPPFISLNERRTSRKSADIVDTPTAEACEGPCVSKPRNDPLCSLTPYVGSVDGDQRKVKKSKKIHYATSAIVGTYEMQSRWNRGVLLMVNIMDFPDPDLQRLGAKEDSNSLIHLFRELDFTIFAYGNVNQHQFFELLTTLTSSSYVQKTECFVMVLMTHGNRVKGIDKVAFCDGSVVDMQEIKDHFQSNKCPFLVNKPKVLIFPFCRGDEYDLGHPKSLMEPVYTSQQKELPETQTESISSPRTNVPTLADTLWCYANTPGYVTHRETDTGSWYIQKFCQVMADHAHDTDLEDILKMTHASVGDKRSKKGSMQTGAYDNLGFNKKLYFNPGFYVD